MEILVLNIGSSSVKFKLFEMSDESVIATGSIEKIGENSSSATMFHFKSGKEIQMDKPLKTHQEAINLMEEMLAKNDAMQSLNELGAIGHRIVHGGSKHFSPTFINSEVLQDIVDASPFAPLHNPAHIIGIKSVLSQAPNVKNVAVFDTSFHQSMPQNSFMYPLPYEFYEKYKIRRYGAHGISHEFVSKEAASFLNIKQSEFNAISLHLGSGVSACAIKNGKSFDTSMGLTPLEGLMMGTRCGDIDASIVFYLHNIEKMPLDEIERIFNKKSGLLGICGVNDMREIFSQKDTNERINLAYEMFCHRIKKYIGAYSALLGRSDAVIFTAKIGEKSYRTRKKVCENLENFGIKIDDKKNKLAVNGEISDISHSSSKVRVLVVPTDEELHIARAAQNLVTKKD